MCLKGIRHPICSELSNIGQSMSRHSVPAAPPGGQMSIQKSILWTIASLPFPLPKCSRGLGMLPLYVKYMFLPTHHPNNNERLNF